MNRLHKMKRGSLIDLSKISMVTDVFKIEKPCGGPMAMPREFLIYTVIFDQYEKEFETLVSIYEHLEGDKNEKEFKECHSELVEAWERFIKDQVQ